MEQRRAERRERDQRVITTATARARARAPATPPPPPLLPTTTTMPAEIDSAVYDTKVRINHWRDTMMEHKKIYYAAELKMYKLELALAKYDNSDKLRWSVRHREMANMIHRDEDAAAERAARRRTPEPAFGYVPATRRLRSEPADVDANQSGDKTAARDGQPEEDDEMRSIVSAASSAPKCDVIPVHSEDYKPFPSTPSIHSYMYHLRQIYGK